MKKKAMFESAELIIRYNISTDHLIDLDEKELLKWRLHGISTSGHDSLDQLNLMKGLFEVK